MIVRLGGGKTKTIVILEKMKVAKRTEKEMTMIGGGAGGMMAAVDVKAGEIIILTVRITRDGKSELHMNYYFS